MLSIILAIIVIGISIFFFTQSNQPAETTVPNPEPVKPTIQKPKTQQKKQRPAAQNQKPIEYKHPNLVTTLKSHQDTVRSVSANHSEKYLLSTSDDRTAVVWSINTFAKGNTHCRNTVERDRAICGDISPDGKGVILAINFNNCPRLLKIEQSNLKLVQIGTDLPVLSQKMDITTINFGFSCRQRNTVKQVNSPWLLTTYSKPELKPSIFITDMSGKNLPNSPIDPGVGDINSVKLSPDKQHFGVCGFASQLKIFIVLDDKFIVKPACTISHKSQIFQLAFDEQSSKVAIVTKYGIDIYDFESVDFVKTLEHVEFPASIVDPGKDKVEMALFYPKLFVTDKDGFYILDVQDKSKNVRYENVHDGVIQDIMILSKHRFVVTAGGKFMRVFRF